MRLHERLEAHWLATSALAGCAGIVASAAPARGAWIYSGEVNIPIPANVDGVYLNVVSGWTGSAAGATPGWDINPFLNGGQGALFTPAGGGVVSTSPTGGVYNMLAGSTVGPAKIYDTGIAGATPDSLLDPLTIGFRFINEFVGDQTQYGWMSLRLPQVGSPGVIYSWAYEDSGQPIFVGLIPSPGAFSLLAIGAAGLAGRRSRKI